MATEYNKVSRTRAARMQSNFTQIPNEALRDSSLSARARGVLGYLLSHSDGFTVTRKTIDAAFPEGRDALTTALKELQGAGYVVVVQDRDEASKFVGKRYLVSDEPMLEESDAELPKTQALENRATEKQLPYIRTSIPKNTNQEHQENNGDFDFEAAFEDWWKLYPRKVSKGQARKSYPAALRKLVKSKQARDLIEAQRVLVEALERFVERLQAIGQDQGFIPHGSTWLTGERWEDDLEAVGSQPQNAQSPASRAASIDMGPSMGGQVKATQIVVQGVSGRSPGLLEVEGMRQAAARRLQA